MARFHSIKLALIQCFLGAKHHSAWYSCNGWPQTASSKSGHVWQTAQQSHHMHGAGRIIVLNRLLSPMKEIESPHVSTSLAKAPFLSWDCGTQDSPVNWTWIQRTCATYEQSYRATNSLDLQTGPGMRDLSSIDQGSVCSWPTAAMLIMWAGKKGSLWWGSETCVTLANSAAFHMFVHVHTHTLTYYSMKWCKNQGRFQRRANSWSEVWRFCLISILLL